MNLIIRNLSAAILIAMASTGVAAESGYEAGSPREKGKKLFEQFRAVESWSHQERIRILQTADKCILAASTRQEFRTCEEQEGSSRRAHLAEAQARRQQLREEAQALRRAWEN
ncbi:MAG: hypothetical protein HC889_14560 [Synechococcaceae cyanobacterium SM1_2_3]|nr:hypothetical protein [Synechococcaceae cyanobacterium SM1_2_3]